MSLFLGDETGNIAPFGNPKLMQAIVSISGTHAESAAAASGTTMAEIWSSVDCFYSVGTSPVATTTPGANNIRLRAASPRTIYLFPGQKISFITTSATGTTEIIEFA